MITERDISTATIEVSNRTGVSVHSVSVTYRRDAEDGGDWTVSIAYRQARSRKGYQLSIDGYGETPAVAALMAVDSFKRAVEQGLVARPTAEVAA